MRRPDGSTRWLTVATVTQLALLGTDRVVKDLFVDETHVKVNGLGRCIYRAIDQHGQVIDVLVSARRDADAARRFFRRAVTVLKVTPSKGVTDAAPVYRAVPNELVPSAWHLVERSTNNPIEVDHSQLKHRPRPMRGYARTGPHR